MVEIKMTGMCENCTLADLNLDSLECIDFDGDTIRSWTISCSHYEVCRKYSKRRAKNDT